MSNDSDRPKKSLKDRARELVEDVLSALEDLMPMPQPQLVPVPHDGRRRR